MSLPTFSSTTTADEVVAVFATEIQGKNDLVTGTSIDGIGLNAARAIAKHANLVIITGPDAERLKLSEEAIKKDVPSANIRRLVLDLASLSAVPFICLPLCSKSQNVRATATGGYVLDTAIRFDPQNGAAKKKG
ncbi:hypothetical protein DFH09DRAFT_1424688 [Mycena vulgaris]|nr:hypothetical protein DFH09DRAFT_1424688 [Mycena vulgaris]